MSTLIAIFFSFLLPISLAAGQGNESRTPISRHECLPVDFSSSFGAVRKQQNTGSCFAFSAADLISYKLKQEISALDILILHNLIREDSVEGLTLTQLKPKAGWAALALKKAILDGVCLESETVSEPVGRDLYADLQMLENKPLKDIPAFLWKGIFTNLTIDQVRRIYQDYPVTERIKQLGLANCRQRIQIANFTWTQHLNKDGIGGGDQLIPTLNTKIAYQPVIINYDSSDLLASGDGVSHFSTVVGRRWNSDKNRCEFRIRNSWGTGNTGYAQNIESQNGYQWVGEPFLEKNLFEVLTLEGNNYPPL